jgi:hypothetical protein
MDMRKTGTRGTFFRVAVLSGLVGIATVMALPAWADKVAICHFPGGDVAKMHTIVVAQEALDAHLAHGDTVGICSGPAAEADGIVQVTMCHKADITITVAAQAVPAHLNHGDTLGPCGY